MAEFSSQPESIASCPKNHAYSTEAIGLTLSIFQDAAVSLRGCQAVVRILQEYLPAFRSAPAASTLQSWLLRVGLHELLRPKQHADDWIWIVDHTIQLGSMKCLLIVGIRQSVWELLKRPLELHDLTMISLEPVETSNGEIVSRQLQAAEEKTGSPRAVVSDQGSDLKRGISLYRGEDSDQLILHDIAHQTALALKSELTNDPRWDAFVKQCGQAQPQVKQTELGCLAPPKQKVKGRYMNLGPLMNWGVKMATLAETSPAKRPAETDLTRLDEKFGWISEYRQALDDWSHLDAIKECVLTYVRRYGYHREAARDLCRELRPLAPTATSLHMAASLVRFVKQQSRNLKTGERLPGSSEVIESLIGKGKRMQGQHSRGGFTRMILGMAASLVDLTGEKICQALETIRDVDLTAWLDKHLGTTQTKQRRAALGGTKTG